MKPVPYPVRDPAAWPKLARPGLAERIGIALRDRRYRRRGDALPEAELRAVNGSVRPLSPRDLVLLCTVRNAGPAIASFFSHYRGLGVSRFAMVDDRSEDGTREFLDAQDDVDRFTSPLTYREARGGMPWRDAMIDLYGRGRWYVSVDADEYLVYPGHESRPVTAFAADLKRAGLKRALAPMLDLYPRGPLGEAVFDPARHTHPVEVAPLIDGGGYTAAREDFCLSVRGGPRARLFGGGHRLSKFPVIFADKATRYNGASIHGPLPIRRNFAPVTAALLHFKFSAAALHEFPAFVAQGTHFNGSQLYRQITESAGFGANLALSDEGSIPFTSSADLVRRGFMLDLRRARDV